MFRLFYTDRAGSGTHRTFGNLTSLNGCHTSQSGHAPPIAIGCQIEGILANRSFLIILTQFASQYRITEIDNRLPMWNVTIATIRPGGPHAALVFDIGVLESLVGQCIRCLSKSILQKEAASNKRVYAGALGAEGKAVYPFV